MKGVRKTERDEAKAMSQCISSVVPMPIARPSTAAIIGLGAVATVVRNSWISVRCSPPCASVRKSLMSLPAEKAPGTPQIRITRTASSPAAP